MKNFNVKIALIARTRECISISLLRLIQERGINNIKNKENVKINKSFCINNKINR